VPQNRACRDRGGQPFRPSPASWRWRAGRRQRPSARWWPAPSTSQSRLAPADGRRWRLPESGQVLTPLSLGALQRPAHEGSEPARHGLGIARCHPELSRRLAPQRSRRRLASQRLRRRRWLRVSGPSRRRRTVASVASACCFRRRSAREIAEHRDDRRVPRRAHGRGRWKIVLQPHLSHRLAAYPGGSGCASRMSPATRRGVPATARGGRAAMAVQRLAGGHLAGLTAPCLRSVGA
jgi:hypothetical protein